MVTTQQILDAKILIVDDEPVNVKVLEETLQYRGHTSLQSVTDSRKAIKAFESYRPDLVLLDLNMPHLTGFQVMEQLKELQANKYTPIMILTAYIDQSTRLRALEAGARDFLTKPFDILEVSMRIKNMLEISLLYNQMQKHNFNLKEKYEQSTLDLAATRLKLENEISQRMKLEEELKRLESKIGE